MSVKGQKRNDGRHRKRMQIFLICEIIVLLFLAGSYYFYYNKNTDPGKVNENNEGSNNGNRDDSGGEDELSPEEKKALEEQERLRQEVAEREALIEQAKKLTLSYDYDGAIELIKSYQGKEGGYEVYPALVSAINELEAEKSKLVLYGGSYTSVTQFNHIFFHSLIADNSKAFDDDYDSVGYNMYMTTVSEFKKIIEKMYEDGYVLVSIHDIAKQVTDENGKTKFVEGEIYLPPGKKPFVLSQDDVSYYEYMDGDGFASRIVIGNDGKPTCEMIMDDGSTVQGSFDMIPIVDEFVEEHPDFSYKGAKGIIALTGYEGVLGYRTNDPTSLLMNRTRKRSRKL